MTPHLARLFRHPIKGVGREELGSVMLAAGACLPYDRHWAVAHEAARLTGAWAPCANFCRGAKAPALMAVTSRLNEVTGTVALSHPQRHDLVFRPDDPADLPAFLDWMAPLSPPDRARPSQIVSVGRGMTDSAFQSVSILSLASLGDLAARMSHDLSVHRWRGNIWLDGLEPWQEWNWIGRSLRIGQTELRIEERITRCRATSADPETGLIDADTLGGLQQAYGHQDFGLYATVTCGGAIAWAIR